MLYMLVWKKFGHIDDPAGDGGSVMGNVDSLHKVYHHYVSKQVWDVLELWCLAIPPYKVPRDGHYPLWW